jgi:hypothetical protein
MKTNRIILAIVVCSFVVIAAILLNRPPITGQDMTNRQAGQQPVKTAATNAAQDVNRKTNAVNENGLFKTIIDTRTGQYAVVNSDKQTVASKDKDGNVIWSVNAISQAIGIVSSNGEVQSIEVLSNDVIAHIGRAVVILDKQTGKSKGAIRY